MICEACERGDCEQCGMQTWCECDCQGPDGIYIPHDCYFADDLDGGRLLKKDAQAESVADIPTVRTNQPEVCHETQDHDQADAGRSGRID